VEISSSSGFWILFPTHWCLLHVGLDSAPPYSKTAPHIILNDNFPFLKINGETRIGVCFFEAFKVLEHL